MLRRIRCGSGYGRESYCATMADDLSKRNKDWGFHLYAPAGSTSFEDREKVIFHPLYLDFGRASYLIKTIYLIRSKIGRVPL